MERVGCARWVEFACALSVVATGCAGAGDAGDNEMEMRAASGAAGGGANWDYEPEPPAFAEVYAIVSASCGGGMSGCHVTGTAAQLTLPDAAAAHAALVEVASRKCAGELLVAPGDAEASVLVQALEGSASCVKAMPLGRDPLAADDIAIVRAWIDAGALPD